MTATTSLKLLLFGSSILLVASSVSPLLRRGAMTTRQQQQHQQVRRAAAANDDSKKGFEIFHECATQLENNLTGCQGGGVRLYLKDGNETRCPIFHEISQNIDDGAFATARDAIQPFFDTICQCRRSKCTDAELAELSLKEKRISSLERAFSRLRPFNVVKRNQLAAQMNALLPRTKILRRGCPVMVTSDCDCTSDTRIVDNRANFGCGGKALECFQQLADEVERVMNLHTTMTVTNEECRTDTMDIDIKIRDKFDASALSEDEIIDGDGKAVTFLDFDTNADYNTACTATDGNFNALSYTAICDQINADTKETVRTVNLIVSGHPRCFASACQNIDRAGLLQSFALHPTEELNSNGTSFWLCAGEEIDGPTRSGGSESSEGLFDGVCDFQTQVISKELDLEIAEINVTPEIEFKMFFYLFNTQTRIVDFPDTDKKAAYETTCIAAGGFFNEFPDSKFTCGDTSEFEVSNFAACLGEKCIAEDEMGVEAAMATMFAKKMSDSKELEGRFGCVVASGAGNLTMRVPTTVAACLAALWYLM